MNQKNRFRPYLTWSFILASTILTLLLPSLDSSLFGVQGKPLDTLAFLASAPFRLLGFPWLTSAFVHFNLKHLVMNLIFFVPLSLMLERAKGSINLIGYLLGIHVTVLLLLSTLTFYRIIPSAYYFGLSHMVFGVLSLWSMQNKKFLLVALMASFLVFQFFETSSSTSVLPHALAFILGLIHGLFFNKSRQVVRRAQSAHR